MTGIAFQEQSDYRSLSEAASEQLLALMHRKPDAVICLATGATPVLTYQLLVDKITAQQVDISRITFVKLDEWVGLSPEDPATCEVFLQQHILKPLGVAPENYISFRSDNADDSECARIVEQITQRGGLDLCVLGIGKNGHLGLNEPDEQLEPACHITHLDERTRLHEMLKQANIPVEKGITLGLRDILAAREVLLLVSGEGKQRAFAQFKEGKVSTQIPASFLWLHPKTTCLYCDM